MKLYNVPRSSYIKAFDQNFLFAHIDGMYSLCWTKDNKPVHLSAWEEVEVLESCPW